MNTIQEEATPSPEIESPPLSYDEAKIESMVFVAPPGLEEPAKKKTRQPNREYMREYYHKHKADISCPFCNMTYTCKSSLVKHQRRSTSQRRTVVLETTRKNTRWKKALRYYRD